MSNNPEKVGTRLLQRSSIPPSYSRCQKLFLHSRWSRGPRWARDDDNRSINQEAYDTGASKVVVETWREEFLRATFPRAKRGAVTSTISNRVLHSSPGPIASTR